jgi:crotonobetainyl-CoA:carnitine CoA-transferase CaiB-like acyl-CoA transferase
MPGPLEGVRVVELAAWVAGPSVAAVLADWGAEVVKVEPPDGDPGRAWATDRNPTFELDNRGKRSMTLDLKVAAAREVMDSLLGRADVFVTNLGPRVLAAFGLDHETLAKRFPRLVCAVVTGYGLAGPDHQRAAYDTGAFWGRAGVLTAMALPGADLPASPGGSGDHMTALATVAGVAAALFTRERTGRGQLVSTSLLRTGVFMVGADVNRVLRMGEPFAVRPRTEVPNPLYNSYAAADGRRFFLLGLQPDRHWPAVAAAIGRPELLDDPRYATGAQRAANGPALIALLSDAFAGADLAHWGRVLDAHGVWWAPVQGPADIPHDPQAVASGAFCEVPTAEGPVEMVASPVDFSDTAWSVTRRTPEAGEHTEEVLLELGLGWEAITELRTNGALG